MRACIHGNYQQPCDKCRIDTLKIALRDLLDAIGGMRLAVDRHGLDAADRARAALEAA